jgi:hypothetical protein
VSKMTNEQSPQVAERRQVMVRYRVKPDRVAENEQLVRAVYDELGRAAPDGFRYATFRLDDGVSFVHVASVETEDGHSPLTEVNAFKAFQANINDRCDEPPVVTVLSMIGSFRLFGELAERGRP